MTLNQDSGRKDRVTWALGQAIEAIAEDSPIARAAMRQALEPESEDERQALRGQMLTELRAAAARMDVELAPEPGDWFASRDALTGLAQSAMNLLAEERAQERIEGAPLFEPYGNLDPRWIECMVDAWKTSWRGDAAFVEHKALGDFVTVIPDRCRIALVADWGGANEAAGNVGARIRAAAPGITIHLGDIYYAGQDNEAREFLARWPMTAADGSIAPGMSYALNGNHEMFSGAHAYFGEVLPKFGQKASYFGLRNTFWQILAFDSAYVEHRLLDPGEAAQVEPRVASQWVWLADKLRNTAERATILLSHHQPLSAFEDENDAGKRLRTDAATLFGAAGVAGVAGWFFGHEHRCTIYADAAANYRARLIGHGCIPHSPPKEGTKPDAGCAAIEAINTATTAQGVAKSGFALLAFDGPELAIEYWNEDGTLFYREAWTALGAGKSTE